MNREEVQLLGFEIVAYAGDARSKLLEALNAANEGDFEKAEQLTEEANECIANAHKAQTNLLAQEAQGDDIAFSITTVSYTHLTLPTTCTRCRSRWSPYH